MLSNAGRSVQVCRTIWYQCLGQTLFKIKGLIEEVKHTIKTNEPIQTDTHSAWNDRHIHNFSYNQTVAIAKANDLEWDDRDTRCALCPLSTPQVNAILWMEKYFEATCQYNPAKEEAEVQVREKQDVYIDYKAAVEAHNLKYSTFGYDTQATITDSTFFELWDVIFPFFKHQKSCDIPGHCQTCANIESVGAESKDNYIHTKLKELHHMHRGGLFNKERYR